MAATDKETKLPDPREPEETPEMTSIKEALHQSEERYRSLLEVIEDGYIELDLAGDLTFWNSSFRKFLGYDESLMRGMKKSALSSPRTRGSRG